MSSSSVSAIFGMKLSPIGTTTPPPLVATIRYSVPPLPGLHYANETGMKIECSSRPQKKATAHHRKTRPKKTQPWDKNRGPAVYPPLPPLPAEWCFATINNDVVEASSSAAPVSVSE